MEFDDCKFQDCNFTETTFRRCKFLDCEFVRCNLSNLKTPQSKFSDTSFEDCKLVGINWTQAAWPEMSFPVALKFHKCIINDSSFFGLFLDEIIIEECKAHGVDFREGSFGRASFTYTDFTDSLFGKSNLANVDFSEASNYNIDIFSNKIDNAIFSRHEAVRLLDCLDIELVD